MLLLSWQLQLPGATLPPLLSQTGLFNDVRTLGAVDGLVAYELNVPFWSDGAEKTRWMRLPPSRSTGAISFSRDGEWRFPQGTVFIKHFALKVGGECRPVETRVLTVVDGGVIGGSYKWRPDLSDAELLVTNLLAAPPAVLPQRGKATAWYYPGPSDCQVCHTPLSGGILGVNTRQLNRDVGGENQLARWRRLGLFERAPGDAEMAAAPKLAPSGALGASVEERARSWLDANCAYCHRPGGTVANFDARYSTPLHLQNLLNGRVLIDEGIEGARVVRANDVWRSLLLVRVDTLEPFQMPPLARVGIDQEGVALLRAWIHSLPGPPVMPPPTLHAQASHGGRVRVTLAHPDAEASILYTLAGEVPEETSAVYTNVLELSEPTTIRARAFKPGFTRSITAQETFVPGNVRAGGPNQEPEERRR